MSNQKRLAEIADIRQGRYLAPTQMFDSASKEAPIPVWGANGILGYTEKPTYTYRVPLVTCRGNGCGLVQWPDEKSYISNNAMGLEPKTKTKLDSSYLYYSLLACDFSDVITGSAQPQITVSHLSSKMVTWVDDENARGIVADVLSGFDRKIDINRRINQTLEVMAQAIFKSWFVDFDPVKAKIAAKQEGHDPLRAAMSAISGKSDAELDALPPEEYEQLAATAALFPDEMEDSELGEIPRGWRVSPFGSLLTHTIGGDWGSDSPDSSNHIRVAIIRGTDIPALDQAEAHRVPIRYTNQKKLASRMLKVGDIVLEVSGGSKDQPTGRSIRMTKNTMREFECPIEPASFCRLLRPISSEVSVILGLHLAYIYAQGKTWEYQNQSTGIANFQTTHFLEYELVTTPPPLVVEKFYSLVNPLLERRHDAQSRRLASLRDTLLPKILSGEIRISDAENMLMEKSTCSPV